MAINKIKYRFMLMQFLLWFTFGTFGIFYVAYLKDLGYSSKFIALGLTLSTIFGISSQYFFGYISDLTSNIKSVFIGLLLAMICTVSSFIFLAPYSVPAIVIMILFSISWMPLEALLDSWIFSTKDLPLSEYGVIRSSGSLGFSIITVIFGGLVVKFGFKVSVLAFIISGTLLFITAITTKSKTLKQPTAMGFNQIKQLITNPRYMGILFFSILIFIGHMGINNFYIYVVQNINGNQRLIGMAASMAAFSEIFGFYLGTKLQKKFNPLLILVGVALVALIRVYFLTRSETYLGILLTAVLQGFSFSIFLGTFKIYISKITPINLLASAQTISGSTYFGIASLFANIVGGLLIDDYGIDSFYKFLNIISVLSIVYIVTLYLVDRRHL